MPDPVQIVQRVFDAINSRDLDAALALCAADVESDWSRSRAPYRGVYRGRDELRGLWESILEVAADLEMAPAEMTEIVPGTVLVVNRVTVRGSGSGVEVAAVGAPVYTVRDGLVTRIELFQTREEAVAAVASDA